MFPSCGSMGRRINICYFFTFTLDTLNAIVAAKSQKTELATSSIIGS